MAESKDHAVESEITINRYNITAGQDVHRNNVIIMHFTSTTSSSNSLRVSMKKVCHTYIKLY